MLALQAITDQFTVAGAGGGRPNDSAICQIRTNEIALSGGYRGDIDIAPSTELAGRMAAIPFARPWELREFHLLGDHMLHTVSTENTPHHTWNNTSLLANFINSGIAAVPATYQGQPFLTGSTLTFGDLRRRQILLLQLAFGSCQATGVLQEALFRQLSMVH